MPCDAIATARAKISNEAIADMLTPEVVKKIIRKYMEEKGEVVSYEQEWNNGVQLEFSTLTVDYDFRLNTVAVQGRSSKLANEIASQIDLVGGLLLQQKLVNDISARYSVQKSERKGQTVVINLEL